ncbi:MAG: hypothetical protein M3N14_08050 [Bacteroidota bacterium]|nr:hypothetical protein [Bacteroidota bacterium]
MVRLDGKIAYWLTTKPYHNDYFSKKPRPVAGQTRIANLAPHRAISAM